MTVTADFAVALDVPATALSNTHPWTGVILEAVGVGFVLAMGWLCVILLLKMQRNEIDLSQLLEEESGGASMSRFQLLLFSVIVGVGIFLYLLNNLQLPDIPPSVLTLLGISASTYAASKGIQFSRPEGLEKLPMESPVKTVETTPPVVTEAKPVDGTSGK